MTGQNKKTNHPIQITIFHTNDMHGRLEAMARLSTYTRQLKVEAEQQGRRTFLWDAGDAADRRVQFCSITKGAAFPHLMNAMGYSLQAMGNAISVTYGPQFMTDVAACADFPILAANFRNEDEPLIPGIREYEIIPLSATVKMGVIGLTATARNFYPLFGLNIPDTAELTQRLITQLKSEGVSIIIVLSHLGLREDQELAEEVPGIDLIIGGHSHHKLPSGEESNGVLIAQTGEHAKAIGRVDLTIDSQTGKVISRQAAVLDIPEDTEPDPAVLAAITVAEGEAKEKMAQRIGELADDFDQDFFHECAIGDMAADVLRDRMQADVGMVSGGLFYGPLKAGQLTLGELDAACFTTANPILSQISGDQLIDALERGINPAITTIKHGSFRGAPVGIAQISGMTVYFRDHANQPPRIERVLIQGQPVEMDRLYRIAHTDAEIMQEIGYLQIATEQIIRQEVPTILREAMAEYIHAHSPLHAPERNRWIASQA